VSSFEGSLILDVNMVVFFAENLAKRFRSCPNSCFWVARFGDLQLLSIVLAESGAFGVLQ